jgi:hypothetical protein
MFNKGSISFAQFAEGFTSADSFFQELLEKRVSGLNPRAPVCAQKLFYPETRKMFKKLCLLHMKHALANETIR